MPKRTISAAGGAMPASGQDDAELLAMCERLKDLRVNEQAYAERLEAAELRSAPPEPPVALLRTEADAKMRLFVGAPIGEPYDAVEIAAIKILCRVAARKDVSQGEAMAVRARTKAILEAWAAWRWPVDADEVRSGVKPASEAFVAAYEAADRLEKAITYLPARTLAGVVAKAWTALRHVAGLSRIEERIDEHMHLYGADDDTAMLAILRDLITMDDARPG